MFDVKTAGFVEGFRRGRCPSEDVAQIEKLYERKARKVDAAFCGAPPGVDGPIPLALRAMHPVWGLGFGAFGE